jgi:hypothetical protein
LRLLKVDAGFFHADEGGGENHIKTDAFELSKLLLLAFVLEELTVGDVVTSDEDENVIGTTEDVALMNFDGRWYKRVPIPFISRYKFLPMQYPRVVKPFVSIRRP